MISDLRVLVVDDHPVNRLVLAEMFNHLGCVVSTAEDGVEALAASNVNHFDLVCLDRHMPRLSGDETLPGFPSDLFVLAWSTDSTDLPRRFNGVLAKPVSIAAVADAMIKAKAWRIRAGQALAPAKFAAAS